MLFRGTMFSEVLEMSMHIAFAGPRTLAEPPARVCYLLHGLCGNSECWIDYTRLRQYAEGRHTLFIMPEAARSFYTDMRYGGQFFTYLTDELPRQCAKLFRIPQGREHTAILGCSAGGYGALKAALGAIRRLCGAVALLPDAWGGYGQPAANADGTGGRTLGPAADARYERHFRAGTCPLPAG